MPAWAEAAAPAGHRKRGERMANQMKRMTINVDVDGVDEAVAKTTELIEAIRKAKSLADDLALALDNLEVDVDL